MGLEQFSYKFGKGYPMTAELKFTEKHGIAPKELIKAREARLRELDRQIGSLFQLEAEVKATNEDVARIKKEIAEIDSSLKILANA